MTSSRERFLDAAETYLFSLDEWRSSPSIPIAQLIESMPDNPTRRSFTTIWPRREDFEAELRRHLATGIRNRARSRVTENTTTAADVSVNLGTLEDNIADIADVAVLRSITSPDVRLLHALAAENSQSEELCSILDETYDIAVDTMAQQLPLFFAIYRRRIAPMFTARDVGVACLACTEGLAFRRKLGSSGHDWVAQQAATFHGVILGMTEPID